MAELHQLVKLQNRLISDQAFRSDFFADPVRAFQQEGVVLSPQAEQELRSLVQTLANPAAPTTGAAAGSATTKEIQVPAIFIVPPPK